MDWRSASQRSNACRNKVEIFVFIDRILVGLTDQPDIKMLCHLTLVRLSIVSQLLNVSGKFGLIL